MDRRQVLVGLAVGAVVAVLPAGCAGGHPGPRAAALLRPLHAGATYQRVEDEAATKATLRRASGATDVAVAIAGTPLDRSPTGVHLAAFVFRAPPDPTVLARSLTVYAPLGDLAPRTIGGQPVLARSADDLFASAGLWVAGAQALLAYSATTAEVDLVLADLLAGR